MRLSLGPGVLDDVRSDDAADQRVEPGRRRGRRRRIRLRRPAEQPSEIVLGVRRGGRPAASKRLEYVEVRVQLVGVEVVDPLEAQLSGRHTEPRFETVHDVVEIVDVDLQRRTGGERRALGRGAAAEIAQYQQAHRLVLFASTWGGARASAELELQ